MMATMEDLPFTIEEWSADGAMRLEILARATNPIVGRAAFDAAVKLRPNAHLLFRHAIRVVAEYRPPARGQQGVKA